MGKGKATSATGCKINDVNENINMKPSNNPSSKPLHPPYFQMISEAITTLKTRKGLSQQAITKFIKQKYESALPSTFVKILSVQLRRLANEGRLTKVKNSYKIATTTTTTTRTETSTRNTVETKVKTVAKMKKLSQVKTPDGMNKIKTVSSKKLKREKTKRLSLVYTPEVLKKKTAAKK